MTWWIVLAALGGAGLGAAACWLFVMIWLYHSYRDLSKKFGHGTKSELEDVMKYRKKPAE